MKKPFEHLKKYCEWADEAGFVLSLVFIIGLFFHIHSQNARIHELIYENMDLTAAYTEHINDLNVHISDLKEETRIANEKAEARAKRVEKLDDTLAVLKGTIETLQLTIEEQHKRIQKMLHSNAKK